MPIWKSGFGVNSIYSIIFSVVWVLVFYYICDGQASNQIIIINMLSKILKNSVSLAMNSAKYPNLKFFALKSDQKDSNHTNFTSKKSASVDSKVEQVNKVDSNLIKPNANNVSVAAQKTPNTETLPQKSNQKQSSSEIDKEQTSSDALKENDQKLKANGDLKNEEKKLDLKKTGFFIQIKQVFMKYYQNARTSKSSKIFTNLRRFWNFVAITSITAWIGFIIQRKVKDYEKNSKTKQILNRYSVFQQKQPYIESPLYSQMKSCLQKQIFGQPIKLVAGCPGIGKTTVTKKILQQMKQRGEEVFYFSFDLGQGGSQKQGLLIKQFYELMSGIRQKFHGDSKYKGKKVKIVLDDINKLERLSAFTQAMKYLYTRANAKEVDIICISSSSGFIERQVRSSDWRSFFQKNGKVIIIQDKNKSQEVRQFHKKVAYQYCDGKIKKVFQNGKEYDNPIIAAVVDLKITTRMIVLLLRDLIEENIQKDEKKALEYMQRFRQQQVSNKQKLITNIFGNISDKNAAANLISKILQTKESLDLNNCSKLKPDADELDSAIAINSILDTLQRQNLLIFCRPRTLLEREAFKIFSEKMKKKSSSK